ncbi:MAG TPA: UDP-N-acetylmuramoyl-L-alanine--D-glutamate ligase [Cyanobacteria bacterium UBA8156]|jgi:UDP-N-acetylmuramoylalanine--D-glutamate ligase|nr:UDP-N-acetylmuramoyl-L-alanine--D-glutamate ligase [Cyanobacteria bacterium UBA8156]
MAAALLLTRRGWRVQVWERQSDALFQERAQVLQDAGIAVALGLDLTPEAVATAAHRPQTLVVSPGISWQHPALGVARSLGVAVMGEAELAWQFCQGIPWVGITGTNGKTTTTALLAQMFQAAGKHAPACGNIGLALCQVVGQMVGDRPDWLIAELSSYQIESAPSVAPVVGIWTTFTPDHLNRHGTLEHYRDIKAALLHRSQHLVLNRDDPFLAAHGARLFPDREILWTGETSGSAVTIDDNWVQAHGENILSLEHWQLVGHHNRQNLLMAVGAAKLCGLAKEAIAQGAAGFRGVPHRLEPVVRIDGIQFINDSKATNYEAAVVALEAIAQPAIVLAGGQAKAGDPQPWLQQLQAKAAAVLLFGEAAPNFAAWLTDHPHAELQITLEEAVPRALVLARKYGVNTVLLAPACASFDAFRNFEERGDRFRQLCLDLAASAA